MRGIEAEPGTMRQRATVRPVGPLAELLNYYEAPEEHASNIARRVGGVFGKLIHPAHVERAIQDSMDGGLPNWPRVEQRVGASVRNAYRALRRAP